MTATNPKVVIVLSGKRKCGKDYVASIIEKRVNNIAVLRIAGPIKSQYAKLHGLDFDKLLDASEYKEEHRKQMVEWSADIRKKDDSYFLRISIEENGGSKKPIWILTDARRESDVNFFKDQKFKDAKIFFIRITASEDVRIERGWKYTPGIDDKETECGLDNYKDWSLIVENNDLSEEDVLKCLEPVMQSISEYN